MVVFPLITPASYSKESDMEENGDSASENKGRELISLMQELWTGESSNCSSNPAHSQSQKLSIEKSPVTAISTSAPDQISSIPASPMVSSDNIASPGIEIHPAPPPIKKLAPAAHAKRLQQSPTYPLHHQTP
ncbi:hypothetical protein K443DRAFT_13386 [Laccaria amethystina LaAM-08-1]|uniref:Uncharacterized protein n=1 Tax=Laccaria amethystina LaAM-08-1 TaxID=1095629 RepID=A0A0C9WPB9_9AGAR|nr:hypothetical protein K443DRAFT_13386 [Laccaria amethystina LaAM-08-1]